MGITKMDGGFESMPLILGTFHAGGAIISPRYQETI